MENVTFPPSIETYLQKAYIRYVNLLKFDYALTAHLEFQTLSPVKDVIVNVTDIFKRVSTKQQDGMINYQPEQSVYTLDMHLSSNLTRFLENIDFLSFRYHNDDSIDEVLVKYEDSFNGENYIGTIRIVFYRGNLKMVFPEYDAKISSSHKDKQGTILVMNADALYNNSKKTASRLMSEFIRKTLLTQQYDDAACFKISEKIYAASILPYENLYWRKNADEAWATSIQQENIAFSNETASPDQNINFSFLSHILNDGLVNNGQELDHHLYQTQVNHHTMLQYIDAITKSIVQKSYQLITFDDAQDVYDSQTIYLLNKDKSMIHEISTSQHKC